MEVVEASDMARRGRRRGACSTTSRRVARSARRCATARSSGPARGRYALPTRTRPVGGSPAVGRASRTSSAAQLNGWELKHRPPLPTVTVPRNRKVEPWRRDGVDLRWRDLGDDDVWHDRTRAGRTVMDCAKDCPFDEAL